MKKFGLQLAGRRKFYLLILLFWFFQISNSMETHHLFYIGFWRFWEYYSSKFIKKMRQEDQFQTSFILGKSIWFPAQFQNISIVLNLVFNKNKLHKTSDYWSRNFLNFEFLEKVLVKVFTPHFFLHEKNISLLIFY